MVGIPLYLVSETMPERETIGQQVRRVRLEHGLTLKQLAALIDERFEQKVSESTIRDLELGKYSPNLKTVEWVALALDLRPLDLIALGLDEEAQETVSQEARTFEKTRFARLWRRYEQTKSPRLRTLTEETVQMLLDRLNKG